MTTDLWEISELAHHGPENLLISSVSVILSFELLIHLIYKAFHLLASSATIRNICISCFANCTDLYLLLNWQARQMWIQPCQKLLANRTHFTCSHSLQAGQVCIHSRKSRLQNRSRFHRSLTWQAGRVDTHFCKNLIFKLCRFTIRS